MNINKIREDAENLERTDYQAPVKVVPKDEPKPVVKGLNKSKITQLQKYGGEEGYRKEMARRRSLHKPKVSVKTEDLVRLREAGLTQPEIAAQLDVSQAWVSTLMKRHNIN